MKARVGHRLSLRKLSLAELRVAAFVYPERGYWRPQTRGDCINGVRPCPYAGCRHHLYLDVAKNGTLRFDRKGELSDRTAPSCALDVVRDNPDGLSCAELGEVMGTTSSRAHQEITNAIFKAKRMGIELPALVELAE